MENKNKAPAVNISASLHNRFDIEVIDAATGELKQRAQALNVICNQLWTRMINSNGSYFSYIHYGTGSGTPSASDTSLFTFLGQAAVADDTNYISYASGYYYSRRKIQLAPETAVGATLTEVGIAYGTGSGTLCTHAMLQDMNGNPISITKTATDVINIYATVYVHFNPAGYGGIYPILGRNDSLNIFRRLAGAYGLAAALDECKYYGGFNNSTSTQVDVTNAYDTSNRRITTTINRLPVGSGNFGGIRRVILASEYSVSSTGVNWGDDIMLIPGGTWYPYSTITNEAVGTGDGSTTDFSLDFPFAHNAVFYVDGVEQNGVTVDYAPNTTNFSAHLIPCESSTVFWPRSRDYSIGNTAIYYNPAYVVGLSSLYVNAGNIDASDDLQTWTNLGSRGSDGTFSIPAGHQNHKYYRFKFYRNTNFATASASFTGNVVHFATPPANGAVITANYQTDSIAKDSDHVFDLTVTLQLGEYTE